MLEATMRREIPKTYKQDGTWKPIHLWKEDDYNVIYSKECDDDDDKTAGTGTKYKKHSMRG